MYVILGIMLITFYGACYGIMSDEIHTNKQSGGVYTYTMLLDHGHSLNGATSVVIRVKACNDAHIALMASLTQPDDNFYEIVIGGWSNKQSQIRVTKQGQGQATHRERDLLSCTEFQTFKLSWKNGNIILYKSSPAEEFIVIFYWQDPNPMPIHFVGVTTGVWASGVWTFELPDPNSTANLITSTTNSVTSTVNLCPCALVCKPVENYTMTAEALKDVIRELKAALTVHKKDTSLNKRRLISANDDRPSAQAVGIVATVFLVSILIFIILVDLSNLQKMFQTTKRNICSNFQHTY